MAIGESAGLLFKIKGDASDAIRALNQTERATDDLTGVTSKLGGSFSSLAGPALLTGAGVAAVGAAALVAVRALFDLTKTAAEFGSTIFDASQKTGLSAERLSAMKFAADQSGTSLDTVTAATARFSKVIVDAANGSEQAQAKLARLGVTSKDLDTALKQALATIVKMPPGTQQMAAAMDAFGKSGADLLPFIKSFDGDLDALTEKAKKLGVTITDEAAAAADKFGDDLAILSAQFDGLGRTIAGPFMGPFGDMVQAISHFLTTNGPAIQTFAQNAADALNGLIITIQRVGQQTEETTGKSLVSWGIWSVQMIAKIDPVVAAYMRLIEYMRAAGAEDRGLKAGALGQIAPGLGAAPTGGGGGGSRGGGGGGRSTRDVAAEKAARLEERDLVAGIRIESLNLKKVQEGMRDAYQAMRDALKGSGGIVGFTEATNEATKQWAGNLNRSLTYLEELEKRALKVDATANERALLEQQQQDRRHKLKLDQDAEIQKNKDAAWEEQLERGEREAEAAQEKFDADMDRLEQWQAALAAMPQGIGGITGIIPTLNPLEDEEAPGPFDAWTRSWESFADSIAARVGDVQTSLGTMAEMLQGAFIGVANAIGSVVQQWVLYGNTGPAVMRKVLASALASIAAEAAVNAIYATALGFIRLAQHDYVAAGEAFTSAALWAAVAGTAAIAGRLVAGNAFQQQAGQATGQTGANTQGSRPTAGAYSAEKDVTYESGINSPAVSGVIKVQLGLDADGVLDVLSSSAKNNGRFRGLTLEVVNSA